MTREHNSESVASIYVAWGRNKFIVNFDERPNGLQEATLGDLRQKCSEVTAVPVGGIKLLYSGAVMKDDSAILWSFGLRPNSKVLMMGTKPNAQDVINHTTTGNAEELAMIQTVNEVLKRTQQLLLPKIQDHEANVRHYVDAHRNRDHASSLTKPPKPLVDMQTYLSEHLMQALFALDSVMPPSEFQKARQSRKDGVKMIQGWQDRVDKINEGLTSIFPAK
ncbi:hypothetical protein BZG36_01396 [Bifiguratus adelaidae]|uniref:BAG domain-containing protein n=1 Tax=Bifiguratus adelaidae TaxID=1938954 RepID=A0A261Y3D6_9FUNG|nr:hypothetical protein BZG36_01396 [Bifiguratus adelaidae]